MKSPSDCESRWGYFAGQCDPSLLGQLGGLIRSFPGELRLGAPEVSVGGRFLINGPAEVQALDDALGCQGEVLADEFGQLGRADLSGPESVDENADRLSYTDRVRQLNFRLVGQPRSHDVLGDIARNVSSRAIDLCRVLAAEGAATVPSGAAISVHDDLAAGQTGVTHGTANDKAAGRIDVVLGVLVEPLGGQYGLDYLLQDVSVQFVVANRFGVLTRNHDSVYARRLAVLVVFDSDLALPVGAQVRKLTVLADDAELACEFVGQRDGCGHQLGSFVGGEAEHHTLVAGTTRVHALRDVARLFVDG